MGLSAPLLLIALAGLAAGGGEAGGAGPDFGALGAVDAGPEGLAVDPSAVPGADAVVGPVAEGAEGVIDPLEPVLGSASPVRLDVRTSADGGPQEVPAGQSGDAPANPGLDNVPPADVTLAGGAAAGASLAIVAWPDVLAALGQEVRSVAQRAFGRLRAPRWLAAVPLGALFSRIDDDELKEQPVRAAILGHLEANAGATIQEVRDALGVAWGTAVYHLGRLERARHVVSRRDGRLRRFWRMDDPEARHRGAAALLKGETSRRIADLVQARPGIHQAGVCDALGLKPPVASKYLGRLREQGLVVAMADGRMRRYHPTMTLHALAGRADFGAHARCAMAVGA